MESFKFTNESKAKLIESLSIAIEQKQLSFPNIPELANELHAFGFELLPSGRMRYCAPGSLHDDCVIALAFSWKANIAALLIFLAFTMLIVFLIVAFVKVPEKCETHADCVDLVEERCKDDPFYGICEPEPFCNMYGVCGCTYDCSSVSG